MTLSEGEKLLSENGISFEICTFESERAYLLHTTKYPHTRKAGDCKVIALSIPSNNGTKNIELQFNAIGDEAHFEELHFGDFCFEMFNYNEDMLAADLLEHINKIQSGNFAVITASDLNTEKWLGDAGFDLSEDDNSFGKQGFEKALERIKKPKALIARLLKTQKQYEIFDWNTYQRLVK